MTMSEQAATVLSIEESRFDPRAVTIAVSELVDTDLVYDAMGILHELDSVSPVPDGSTWLCRKDLPFAEHLTGRITVCRTHKRRRPVTARN